MRELPLSIGAWLAAMSIGSADTYRPEPSRIRLNLHRTKSKHKKRPFKGSKAAKRASRKKP